MDQSPPRGRERRSPTPGAARKREAIRRLKQALAEGALELHYQPIVSPGGGQAAAVEALLKWRRQEPNAPALTDLIWSAERSPVIFKLENWILDVAFRVAAEWRRPAVRGPRVNVNVSAREFPRADLVRRLSRLLEGAGLGPGDVSLEITETSAMHDLEEVAGQLGRLRDMGVELWLDDFGTGHSSLEWLSHFPLDGLKMAATFVKRLAGEARCRTIARHVIGLAHDLGLRVVAEGVETPEQRELLAAGGCDLMQGFLFHPPLPARELGAALAQTPPAGVRSPA